MNMTDSKIPLVQLNDGNSLPVIAFGTGTVLYNKDCKDQVISALSVGYNSLDGAQVYENTKYIGQGLAQSELGNRKIYLTNKWGKSKPGDDVNEPRWVLEGMLKELGVNQLDLFLIHTPVVSNHGFAEQWKVMEQIKKDGLARSIGVSNFREEDLLAFEKQWEIPPAVNQIEYHPYVAHQPNIRRLRELMDKHDIKIQAYSPLVTLHSAAGGPVDSAVEKIASDEDKTPSQVLLQWAAQYGGGTVVTTSRNIERQREQLAAFTEKKPLSEANVKTIAEEAKGRSYRKYLKEAVWDAAKP